MAIYRKKDYLVTAGLFALFVAMMPQVCAQTKNASAQKAATTRTKLIKYCKDFLGCPYRSGSTGPATFDCSGFVFSMFRDGVGIQLPRQSKSIYKKSEKIKDEEREIGDLVFFSGSNGINHVGIYIGDGKFIHSASDGRLTGVIESSLSENYWKKHYTGSGRYIAPADFSKTAQTSKSKEQEKKS